jgi:hypothetical protein
MKQFFFKTLLFSLLTICVFVAVYFVSDLLLNYRKGSFLRLKKNTAILFAGDSNIACNVNDSLVNNAVNIAFNGESYMYTYLKLKNILEYNPQIKTVVINYSQVNLHKSAQDTLLFRKQEVYNKNEAFNYLMKWPEIRILLEHNPKDYIFSLRESIINNYYRFFKTFQSQETDYRNYDFGGYYFLAHDKLEEDKKKFLSKKYSFEKATIQMKYLNKISILCKEKNAKLILLNTPKHIFYLQYMDKEMNEFWQNYSRNEIKDSILDYSSFELPDSCYSDLGHLNYRGARVFSEYLSKQLYGIN